MLIEMSKTDVLFVKILQAISFNGNFIDSDVHARVTQFADNVPYDISDIDFTAIKTVIKNTPFRFGKNAQMPIRSGMISLVYELIHEDTGKEYILKVKRRNIDERLNESINNMMGLLYFLSVIFKWVFSLDVIDVVARHIVLLREQLDFSQEERNTIEARADVVDVDYIRIPEVYECECLSGYAIIMERLPGKHLNDIPKDDKEVYRDLAIKYFLLHFIHHRFHGDLHSGNVLFIDNGPLSDDDAGMIERPRYQLGIIDFGIVTHFPTNIPNTLFYIFEHQHNREMLDSITRAYLNNFIHPPNMLRLLDEDVANKIVIDSSRIAEAVFIDGELFGQTHLFRVFRCISDNLSHRVVALHDIKTSDGFAKFEVSLSMCISLVSHLTDEDPNTHMKRVFDDMFHADIMFSK